MSSSSPEPRVLRVSELNNLVKLNLESRFGDIHVLGEASGVTLAASGHLYFTLKDESAAIRVVMFRSALARSTLTRVENGQQVIVHGVLSLYPPRGEVQIVAQDIKLQGIGDIYAALEKLKKFYQEKGYFDPARKKRLPLLPKRIGVVTSPTGAAFRDIIRILHRRFPEIEVILYPAKVQGEGSALEVAAGIDYFNDGYPKPVDVLIVGRGGGSYEDLWAFNEAAVVEAIYRSHIPVISAVGHEIDFTIADFVADVRAATPSAAAELVVGKKDEFLGGIDLLRSRLLRGMESVFHRRRGDMMELVLDSALTRFPQLLLERGQRIDNLEFALGRAIHEMLRRKSEDWNGRRARWLAFDFAGATRNRALAVQNAADRLDSRLVQWLREKGNRCERLAAKLAALGPENILRKGYSITSRGADEVVRDADRLHDGENVSIRFFRGRVDAVVKKR